jgi:predicted alpha/beta superfamily hydrolase
MNNIQIGKITCTYVKSMSQSVCYILTPIPIDEKWLTEQAQRFGCNMVAVEGMNWNRDMTPWPAPRVIRQGEDFDGKAGDFLSLFVNDIVSAVEKELGLSKPERSLVGISLSGLFALWTWVQSGNFKNLVCLSASFWYEGFTEWLNQQKLQKDGKVYISLGERETHDRNPYFGKVGACTESVVQTLKERGIQTFYELDEGGHHAPLEPRLAKAFKNLFPGSEVSD